MMNYTTIDDLKAYGKTLLSSAGEAELLATLIPAVSRKIDQYGHQVFGEATVVNQGVHGVVDASGVLLLYPPTPIVTTLTALTVRCGNTPATVVGTAECEIEPRTDGCIVRCYGDYRAWRGHALRVAMSYTGGWNEARLPDDFRWLTTRACWWEFKKRDAPMEKTAIPEMGVVVIPQAWPHDLKEGFMPYVRRI